MKTLKDAKVGDTVIVAKLHGEGAVKQPHYGMGITKGVEIHIRSRPAGVHMELMCWGTDAVRDARRRGDESRSPDSAFCFSR